MGVIDMLTDMEEIAMEIGNVVATSLSSSLSNHGIPRKHPLPIIGITSSFILSYSFVISQSFLYNLTAAIMLKDFCIYIL